MFSRDELARSKERNEKQPRRRATGRLKKKKKKFETREILQRWKDRLQKRSFNNIKMQRLERIFHLPFPSWSTLSILRVVPPSSLQPEYIYIFPFSSTMSVRGRKERAASFSNQVEPSSFNEFFWSNFRRGREKRKEKRTVLFSFNNYLSREREIIRNLFRDSTGSSLALIYSMSTNRKHNRFVTRHWIYLQQR